MNASITRHVFVAAAVLFAAVPVFGQEPSECAPEPPILIKVEVQEIVPAGKPVWRGEGTLARPYRISTLLQLQAMRSALSAHYILTGDIDASETVEWNNGAGFEPIGCNKIPFTGTFDGRGHSIRGLVINRFGRVTTHIGLFGFTGKGAVIRNVSVEQAMVKGCDHVGILVGANAGEIIHCHVSGDIAGSGSFGGMVGSNRRGILQYCSSAAAVKPVWVGNHLGGLVGINSDGIIADCLATGTVQGLENPGGLVGGNIGGLILRSYAISDVHSTFNGASDAYRRGAGGLVGSNQKGGRVIDSFAAGRVSAPSRMPAGSLVGISMDDAVVFNSYGFEAPDHPLSVIGNVYGDAGVSHVGSLTEMGASFFRRGPLASWDFGQVWTWDAERPLYPVFRRAFDRRPRREIAVKLEMD